MMLKLHLILKLALKLESLALFFEVLFRFKKTSQGIALNFFPLTLNIWKLYFSSKIKA